MDGGTELSYHGPIPVDFWVLGRLVARWLILPEYERLLGVHIAALAKTSEAWAGLSPR